MTLDDINLCDLSQFERGCPHDAFALLRREAPVWFHPATPQAPDGEGFWVIARHADARAVLKDCHTYSSETGYGARVGGGTTLEDMSTDMAPGVVLSMMDPPKHDAIRGLVNQGFFPRTLQRLEKDVASLVDGILDNVADQTEIDFLNDVAAQLPLQVICTMAGIPRRDWPQMGRWADAAIAYAAHDPESDTEKLVEELTAMGMYAFQHIQQLRERDPDNSVMSQVVHATIPSESGDGVRQLDDLELVRFFNLLITGGTETTRNAIAGGLHALLTHPEQYQALEADPALMDNAIEEILRWTSPVHFNRRTVAEDTELQGQTLRRGDKVTVWYSSANFDDRVFDDPYRFDIFRANSGKHIAFGAGIHHCIGAALARMEIRLMLTAVLERYHGQPLEPAGALKYIRSNRHQGLSEMRLRVRG